MKLNHLLIMDSEAIHLFVVCCTAIVCDVLRVVCGAFRYGNDAHSMPYARWFIHNKIILLYAKPLVFGSVCQPNVHIYIFQTRVCLVFSYDPVDGVFFCNISCCFPFIRISVLGDGSTTMGGMSVKQCRISYNKMLSTFFSFFLCLSVSLFLAMDLGAARSTWNGIEKEVCIFLCVIHVPNEKLAFK